MKFPNFRRAIRSLFPPPRRFYQHPAEIDRVVEGGVIEWVLARALVHYKSFTLSDIPQNQRVSALRMRIRQWTPFSSFGSCVVIERDTAMVWVWNKTRIEEALETAGLQPSRVKIIPETLIVPRIESGLRLISTMEGTEAQAWTSFTLVASRWWPAPPTTDEWLTFQRDAAFAELLPLPVASQAAPFLEEPWARVTSLEQYRSLDTRFERLIYACGISLLATATLWYGVLTVKNTAAVNSKKMELDAINDKAQPVIAARKEAQATLLRVHALLAADPYPNQLRLMALVAEALPKNGTHVGEWNYQGGKLKLLIAVPDPGVQSSGLVSALQTAGSFNNVRSAAGGDSKTLVFNMDVTRQDGAVQ